MAPRIDCEDVARQLETQATIATIFLTALQRVIEDAFKECPDIAAFEELAMVIEDPCNAGRKEAAEIHEAVEDFRMGRRKAA